jgi:hypothetical protein
MNRMMVALASAALAGVPAAAMQPQAQATREVRVPHTVAGQLILFEMPDYNGDAQTIDVPSATVQTDWNIRSIAIHPGDRWEICARSRFRDCIILDRSVHDASLIGVVGQIGSARPAPPPAPAAQPH